jgi:hypothetical protein
MRTTCITQARVYLHPAALTSPDAIRAIEHATGLVAFPEPGKPCRRILLLERAAIRRWFAQEVRHA